MILRREFRPISKERSIRVSSGSGTKSKLSKSGWKCSPRWTPRPSRNKRRRREKRRRKGKTSKAGRTSGKRRRGRTMRRSHGVPAKRKKRKRIESGRVRKSTKSRNKRSTTGRSGTNTTRRRSTRKTALDRKTSIGSGREIEMRCEYHSSINIQIGI